MIRSKRLLALAFGVVVLLMLLIAVLLVPWQSSRETQAGAAQRLAADAPVPGSLAGSTPASASTSIVGAVSAPVPASGASLGAAQTGVVGQTAPSGAGQSGVAGGTSQGRAGAPAGQTGKANDPDPVQFDVAKLLEGVDLANPSERSRVAYLVSRHEENRMKGVVEKARSLGIPTLVKKPGGGTSEIFGFEGDEPIYRTTFNVDAGISSGADILRGSGFGGLSGRGLKAGVWDGGLIRPTHQEFNSGQVTLRDLKTAVYDDHATHVAATLGGVGFKFDAQGMAPAVTLDSYYWDNDHGEMILAGAALTSGETGKIPISNHSYGIIFSPLVAGYYEQLARATDAVAYGLPYYLQFWAAGNSQGEQLDGYFTMSHYQLAKNVVTVGAVEDAVDANGMRDATEAAMSDFSSWGPVKDGRIKPDLVANGVDLYSATSFSDQSYMTMSGTSMASPSAAGTAALLTELYQDEFGGQLPRSSLLKALLIHTADDRGRPGPDYQYGWGLINGEAAGNVIREHKTTPKFFTGTVNSTNRRWTHTFTRGVGAGPVRATLVWTDPPGAVGKSTDTKPTLVHNLDLEITGPDGVKQPYVMPYVGNWTPATLDEVAIRGKNNTDNVEQVDVPAAIAGEYVISVTADGPMVEGQTFSLVLTGSGPPVNPRPVVNLQTPQGGGWFLPGKSVPMRATATDLQANGSPGTIQRVEFFVGAVRMSTDTVAPYEFDGWVPMVGNYKVEAVAYDNEGKEGYSNPAMVAVRQPLPGEVHPVFTPPSANAPVSALAEDDNGRIYIGGLFTTLNATNAVSRLARLKADGSLDNTAFLAAGGPNDRVRVLTFSPSQKALYVGGDFTKFGDVDRLALAKVRVPGMTDPQDGTLDTSFTNRFECSNTLIKPSVRAVIVQPDGKILVGGLFDRVNGVERRNLVRFMENGQIDETFKPGPRAAVNALVLHPDGKILVGGEFTSVEVVDPIAQRMEIRASNRLARLNPDGSFDATLVLGTGQQTGFNGPVYSLALSAEEDIYVGGAFSAYRGHAYHANLVKIAKDGSLKGQFNFAPGLDGAVNSLLVNSNGTVLTCGAFANVANELTGLAATPVGRVVQFTSDGALDPAFNVGGVGADGTVHNALRLQSGHTLLAGSFANFNGVASARMALIAGAPSAPAPAGRAVSLLRAESLTGAGVDMSLFPEQVGKSMVQVVESTLPRGVTFDQATGRLKGVALEAGDFRIRAISTGVDGKSVERNIGLQVSASAVSYNQWRDAWFGSRDAAISAPEDVNNTAGLSNLEVYALSGGNPRTVAAPLLPKLEVVTQQGGQRMQWVASKFSLANLHGVTNVAFSPQLAEDLAGPWRPATVLDQGDRLDRLVVPVDPSVAPRQFMRLKIGTP